MPRCRVPVLARVVAHLRYWQAGRGRPSSSPLRCALLRMPRYACFSWLAAWRHRRGLHDRRLLLFACMVHPVRLLGICRVDRLDESFLWPALCRLGCHRRSGPHHFRCCLMICYHRHALFRRPCALCHCCCFVQVWIVPVALYGSSDAPVAPAVAARPLPGVVAIRARRMLFVAFPCSSWPSRAQILVAEKYAGKNELEKMLVFL